jgi:hypothetical protein
LLNLFLDVDKDIDEFTHSTVQRRIE